MSDATDNEPEGELVQIELINLSERRDDELRKVIQDVIDDLELNEDVRFIFQRLWTELDEDGNIVAGTEQEVLFDGDAHSNNSIRVCLSSRIAYPIAWNINPKLNGEYLRQINWFYNEDEFLVYFVAHEGRHLFQWQNEFRANLIYQLMECDSELDADLYATRTLSRYRQEKYG